jgi:hypothetical protein
MRGQTLTCTEFRLRQETEDSSEALAGALFGDGVGEQTNPGAKLPVIHGRVGQEVFFVCHDLRQRVQLWSRQSHPLKPPKLHWRPRGLPSKRPAVAQPGKSK